MPVINVDNIDGGGGVLNIYLKKIVIKVIYRICALCNIMSTKLPKHLRQAASSFLVGDLDKVGLVNFLKAVDKVIPISSLIMTENRMNT